MDWEERLGGYGFQVGPAGGGDEVLERLGTMAGRQSPRVASSDMRATL